MKISILLIKSSTVPTIPKTAKKLLEIINDWNFKLLNNGYLTYQSNQYQSQSMLDLHFCSLSLFKYFDNIQELEKIGSDHSATLTSLKLKVQTEFDLQAKVNLQKTFKSQLQTFLFVPTKLSKQRQSDWNKP